MSGDTETVAIHQPCPDCGSSDALTIYSDHTFCFSCQKHTFTDEVATPRRRKRSAADDIALIHPGEVRSIRARGLHKETCQKFNYTIGEYDGETVHVAPFYDDEGRLIAQKLRFKDKRFLVRGDMSATPLFGQRLWRDGGKRLVITEGEIDALSYAQATNLSWPVVSIPNGAAGALKAIRANLEWIEKFDTVVFLFDSDEPGQKAARECAEIIAPGKARIAELPLKDANEMLLAGRVKELMVAVYEAKSVRPDGIILGSEVTLSDIKKSATKGFATPYEGVDEKLRGIRKAELTMLTAGTGAGKSTLARELGYHFIMNHGLKVANIYLEEQWSKTAQGYIAIHNNVPLGELRANPERLADEVYQSSLDDVIRNGRNFFYAHFGSLDSDNLLAKLRYFAVGLQVDFIILDHISIVISGQESSKEGERKDIDILMTRLRSLIEETGVGVIAISHLKQPEGKPHEEGGRVTLNQLRGSGSLKQLSDNIVAVERDQQGEDANTALIRILKNREFGDVGPASLVEYVRQTGRLEDRGIPSGDGDEPRGTRRDFIEDGAPF